MRKVYVLFLLIFVGFVTNVNAQLLQWNTFGNLGTETTEPSVFNDVNLSGVTNLTLGPGITGAANGNRFGGNNWWNIGNSTNSTLTEAVAGNDYLQFIVTPNSGFSFTPTSFVFNWDHSASGPNSVTLRSSVDGYTANLGSVTSMPASISVGNTISISGLTAITTATTFRLYGYGGTATGGTGGFDVASSVVNVQLNGSTASTSTATKLAITAINPTSPTVNAPFSVTVQSQDASNVAANVTANTNVTLSLFTGSGVLGGTLTGTILANTNSIVISGLTYNTVESGVVITATRTSGDVLTAGNSAPFNVLAAASQLVLVGVPATGFTNTNLTTFTVEARRPDNSVDLAYTSNITIAKVSGPGNVIGTVIVAAVAGVATFNAVQIDAIGTYTINASDGILTSATSGNIVIVPPPSLTEFLLPQYIQGLNGTNNNRLPYVYRATIDFLLPNTTYRYTNLVCTPAELLTPAIGAGIQIFYNASGNFVRNAAGISLAVAGQYGEFTTDGSGSYTGWFITEPSTNVRFTPGNQLHLRLLLNDGAGGSTVIYTLTSTNTAIVTNLGTAAADGTGIYGMTHTANRDLVFLYDNVGGTGRPLTSTFIESDGTTGGTTYPTFYQNNVDAIAKAWGTFIPNTLANGVRRIQYLNGGGNKVYAFTSTDGAWPGAISTVNPTGGTTALLIDRTATGTSGDFIVDSAVTLATAVTVNNSLTLNTGIVTTTATNLLTLPDGASTTGASNLSFVHGPIKKIGQTLFTFPVGKTGAGYVPIEISTFVGGTTSDEFTAEYIRSSARLLGPVNAGAGLSHVSGCDYWTLVKGIATPSSLDVKAYWNTNNPCGQANSYITNTANLTIARFDNGPNEWNSYALSPMLTGGSNTVSGSITWPGATLFGPLSLASKTFGDNPLPITINYFTGAKQNGNHLLNWKVTCVSTPSATIEMERSTDGRNYNSIYSIFATAVRCQQPFNYTDNTPTKGINYYRLKMTDADGKVTYSSIVSLINATKGMDVMNIAPNPIVNAAFNLKISAAEKTQMEVVITDMQGRIMQKQILSLTAGFNIIPMSVRNLAAGTYQLHGNTADGKTRMLRFVIQ